MTITFTPSTSGVTLDETGGLQFNGSAGNTVPATDNDDSDVSLATLLAQRALLNTELFTTLGLSSTFSSTNGLAHGTIGTVTSTTPITGIKFAYTNGTSSGLFAVDGKELFLYGTAFDPDLVLLRKADGSGNADPNGAIVAAIDLEVDVDGTSTSEGVNVWMAQFGALKNSNTTNPDDTLALANLSLTVDALLKFDFSGAPSGQNYFMLFGKQNAALLVSGGNPVDDTTNTNISTGDTVNTSQGGGKTTLGVNNQMVDPGEGMHFRFVTLANTNYLVPNLDQNEADIEANTIANGLIDTTGAGIQFVQTQPGGGAGQYFTAKLTAYEADKSAALETGTHYGEELDNDTPVAIKASGVKVTRGGVNVAGTDPPGSAPPVNVTVDNNGVLTVSGLKAGDELFYTTAGVHNHVFVQAVSGAAFDIGGFTLLSSEQAPFAINNIKFDDAAPTANISDGGGTVTVDESTGIQNDDTTDSTVLALFDNEVVNKSPDLSTAQYAVSATPLVSTSGSVGGADGIQSTAFSLAVVGGDNTDSGLTTTDGKAIRLFKEGDLIVGRYDTSNGTVTQADPAAFAIAMKQDGNVAVAQYASLHHPNAANPDDQIDLAGKVNAVATVTDGDGDTSTASFGIGDKINFDDDGPTLSGLLNSTNSLIFANGTTETKSFTFTTGADNESAAVAITDFTNPDNAGDLAASNLDDLETLMGVNITASQVGNTVTYYTPDGSDAGTDPDKLFELTATNSAWTFTIFQDAPLVFNNLNFSTLAAGGPQEILSLEATNSSTFCVFNGFVFGAIDAPDGTESRGINPLTPIDLPNSTADDLNPDSLGFGVKGGAASNMNNNEGFSITFHEGSAGGSLKTVEGISFKVQQQGNTDDVVLSFDLIKGAQGGGDDPNITAIEKGSGINLIGSENLSVTDDGHFWLRLGLPNGNNDIKFTILDSDFQNAYTPAANEIVVYADGSYETAFFRTAYPDNGTFDQYPGQVNDSIRIKDMSLIERLPVPNMTLDFSLQGTDGDGDVTTTGVFKVFVSEDGFAF